MATNYVTIRGYIKDGQLIYDLPENVTDGEVRLEVPIEEAETSASWEESPWTEEELADALQFRPVPGNEIETGGWEDMGITDSIKFVEEVRRKAWGSEW